MQHTLIDACIIRMLPTRQGRVIKIFRKAGLLCLDRKSKNRQEGNQQRNEPFYPNKSPRIHFQPPTLMQLIQKYCLLSDQDVRHIPALLFHQCNKSPPEDELDFNTDCAVFW